MKFTLTSALAAGLIITAVTVGRTTARPIGSHVETQASHDDEVAELLVTATRRSSELMRRNEKQQDEGIERRFSRIGLAFEVLKECGGLFCDFKDAIMVTRDALRLAQRRSRLSAAIQETEARHGVTQDQAMLESDQESRMRFIGAGFDQTHEVLRSMEVERLARHARRD